MYGFICDFCKTVQSVETEGKFPIGWINVLVFTGEVESGLPSVFGPATHPITQRHTFCSAACVAHFGELEALAT